MFVHQHLVQEMGKVQLFMMMLKELWLIVTQTIRSLQEINETKTKEDDFKSMGAF